MNELPEIQRFLAAHAPFSVLPADAVEKLSRHVSISYQPKETLILKADEPCEELFVLRTGAVGFYDDTGNMIEKRANGDVFTNPLVRARRKLSCDVKTLEDSLLYHVPIADIEMLRRTHTEFDDHFSDTMGTRVSLALKKRPEFAISGVTVETIMSSPPVCCDETDSIQAVAQKMRDKRVSSLLVCAPNGGLQGIVTDRDLRNRVVAAGMASAGAYRPS